MAQRYDVLTSGYVSLDRILQIRTPAQVGFTSIITNKSNTELNYGGCSVNIAYAMSRLGLVAAPVLRVGGDYEQTGLKNFLESGGIPTDAVTVIPEERTSVCYLVQDNEGQHITLYYPGAMSGDYAKPLAGELFVNTRVGVLTVGARCDNEEFLAKCKQHQVPLVFGMKGDMEAFPRESLDELLRYCKIIFTNECERQTIEGLFGKDLITLFRDGNAEIIVTTLGACGSRVYWKEGSQVREASIPVCSSGPVVDTTGCGDAFMSGFLYGWLDRRTPQECAMLGTVLASFILEKEGCCTNAPDEAALKARFGQFKQQLERK